MVGDDLQDFSVSPSALGTNRVLELLGLHFGLGLCTYLCPSERKKEWQSVEVVNHFHVYLDLKIIF